MAKKVVHEKGYYPYKKKYLTKYFTKNTSFYYNFDSNFALLFADLLERYYDISKQIIDYKAESESERKVIIKRAIKNLRKYKKYDPFYKHTNIYRERLSQSMKELAKIWPGLWY